MRYIYMVIVGVMIIALASCDDIKNSRTPVWPVNINIGTTGQWVTYGVHAYGEYRMFNKSLGLPTNPSYPYTANTYTGFGGVLLILGYNFTTNDYSTPMAFDLSCPVENTPDTRVKIDANNYDAVCPVCGSHYSVIEGGGTPLSGPALQKKYGLQRYRVTKTTTGGYIISRL